MKKRRLHFILFICILSIATSGCGLTQKAIYKSVPEVQTCSNPYFNARIKPTGKIVGGRQGFILTIINNTDKDLELDWNKTYFIKGDQTSGGFMFEGIIYRDRQNPKPPDIIFPKQTFIKDIWPNNLVEFNGGWKHKSMGGGQYGVLLSIKVDGKQIKEKMLITFVSRL